MVSTGYDLVIAGGTLVSSRGTERADVYISGGRVARITTEKLPAATRFEAPGRLVMPGMVDAHVHFMDPGDPEREDFPTASAAALRAGVTTVIEHTHSAPVRNADQLARKVEHLAGRACCDYALGAHAWPGQASEAAGLASAGAAFLKVFTCTTHGLPGHDRTALDGIFAAAAAAGAVCLVHCEDEQLTASAEQVLRLAGRTDPGIVPEWRNRPAELRAVSTVAQAAAASGANVVVAHASCPEVLDVVAGWGASHSRLRVESCPQYLSLLESEVTREGPLRKFTPPARARGRADLAAMWSAVASGRVDYISSDHAPSTREQKLAGSIWDVHFGLPGIDTTLSVLLDGAARQLVTYSRVVEMYSTAPAAIYGLAGKGKVEPGADADVVIVDPDELWTVADADIRSRAGWSPYTGRTLRGRAIATFLRGELVMYQGEVTAQPGRGSFVRPQRALAGSAPSQPTA